MPKTLMTSIMAPWPFYQWGMDVLGPLPEAPKKVKYVIVAIDYFTKWIEAKLLARTTGKEVKNSFGTTSFVGLDNQNCTSLGKRPSRKGKPESHGRHKNAPGKRKKREAAAIREARYKMKVEQYYNKRVCPMAFKVGEYVYRRNEASRVEDLGKLGPKWEGPYLVIEAYGNGSYKLQTMEGKEVPRTWHVINLRRCYL
ncbi:reverse transcriptase domain-containing protein [Tanacetum coccineum]